MRTATSLVLAALGTCLLSVPAAADKIVKTDGKTIDGITIVEETLAQVIYKRGNSQQSVASADVLSVQFAKKPRLVDAADQALVDGDPVGALFEFNQYVDGQINKPNERKKDSGRFLFWAKSATVINLVDRLRLPPFSGNKSRGSRPTASTIAPTSQPAKHFKRILPSSPTPMDKLF